MPIKPPNLDDRRYQDIVREAMALIPQYCPEWTNFGDADPGITLVQLFAWMTELTIYRLNRVPDKTYVHFLNFIGEERKRARPAVAPLTFALKGDRPSVELPAHTRASTRQREDAPALDFLSVDRLTVHGSKVLRVMSVRGGSSPAVREVPITSQDNHPSVLALGEANGVELFTFDPNEFGMRAFTADQWLYVGHDDLRRMDVEPGGAGRLRIRRANAPVDSIAAFFHWEYPTAEGWLPIETDGRLDEASGQTEIQLHAAFPGIVPCERLGGGDQNFDFPETLRSQRWWIRGRLDYEGWLARTMLQDLEVLWRDDRGGEERAIHNWEVRALGRTIELFLQDVPPLRAGWTLRFTLVERGMPAGRTSYLPPYRWSFRRGETWEEIPPERIRIEGATVTLVGPLTDMATDGFNLRAERLETVFIRGFCRDLELDLEWLRPIVVHLAQGDDSARIESLDPAEGPWSPFQIAPMLTPSIGRRFLVGADVFDNRRQAPVLLEVDVGFEQNGVLVAEPRDKYLLQLTYRAEDSWRVVWTEDRRFGGFTFADLDPDGAQRPSLRKIRVLLDPKTQLKGLAQQEIGGVETAWLRLELVRSTLTGLDAEKKEQPIVPRIHGVRVGFDKSMGASTYDQPMPGPKSAQVTLRPHNRRLTRVLAYSGGRLTEHFPFFPFVEIQDENLSLYLQFDRPLPVGNRHAIHFRLRGEAWLPPGVALEWEMLEQREGNRFGWKRLRSREEGSGGDPQGAFQLARSGVLEFPLSESPATSPDGFWIRGRFVLPEGLGVTALPSLPPVTHLLLNTVDGVNLHTQRTERYSGLAVPQQVLSLHKKPVFVHEPEGGEPGPFSNPDAFDDIVVVVEQEDGTLDRWQPARDGHMLTASKDDKLFVADPVEGTLTFGSGIRGRMLPAGSNNVVVDTYRWVPGSLGNVGPGQIVVCDGHGDAVRVTNVLPAHGGRDAETVDDIVRRAPSILTSRDRAVTRADFEIIAKESSTEVARAACTPSVDEAGKVLVTILPQRRGEEPVPDPFLSEGLRDHVSRYLRRRCLINIEPVVRLARFQAIDVSLSIRLRPNANLVQVREEAEAWIARFLDPYRGGLDGEGWPFGGTLYAQDFGRMVSAVPEIRHVVDVQLYPIAQADVARAVPAWEHGVGERDVILTEADLVWARRVRVRMDDEVEP